LEQTEAGRPYPPAKAWRKPEWWQVNEDGWLIVDEDFWRRIERPNW
jgi:hypothetical protein